MKTLHPPPVPDQAYDVPLATNDNFITLRVVDRAGNVTTNNFNVVLDYRQATNPVVTLTCPPNPPAYRAGVSAGIVWTAPATAVQHLAVMRSHPERVARLSV